MITMALCKYRCYSRIHHKQMGFDGFFFARIDYGDKDHRLAYKRLEMVWRGSESLGSSTEIFTGVLFNGYGPPRGFCFDQGCHDQPIMVCIMFFTSLLKNT